MSGKSVVMGRGRLEVDGVDISAVLDAAGVNAVEVDLTFPSLRSSGSATVILDDRHAVLGQCLKAASSPARLAGYVVVRRWPCGCVMTPEEESAALAEVMASKEPLAPAVHSRRRKRRFR